MKNPHEKSHDEIPMKNPKVPDAIDEDEVRLVRLTPLTRAKNVLKMASTTRPGKRLHSHGKPPFFNR